MGMYYVWIEEDFSKGKQYLNDASEQAEKVGDFLALWFVNQQLSVICFDYQFDECMAHLKTALDLSFLSNNLMSISIVKSTLAVSYNCQGKPDQALQVSKEALQAATEGGDIYALQVAYFAQGMSYYYKGHFQETEKHLLEGMAFYEKSGLGGWGALATGFLGWTYHDMGNYGQAKKYHQQCISIYEDLKIFPSWLNCNKLLLKMNRILNGEPDIDVHKLDELMKGHEKNRLAMAKSFEAHCIGKILLHIDDHHMAEAETWIRRSIDFDGTYAIPWNLGKDHALYADCFKKKGDIYGAKEQLTKAIDLFRECGADGWVTMTEQKLASLT
jgi:tetratricopeptide (TPR) repeat protein